MMKQFFILTFTMLLLGQVSTPAQERITKYIPSAKPERIILNVTENMSGSMAVTWRTDTTVNVTVAQISPNLPTIFLADSATSVTGTWQDVTADGVTARFHSVVFTGLTPATEYAYRVGSDANASEWFTFRTAEETTAPFNFLWLGDSQGPISLYARVIRQAYRKTPDASFMIFSGDLVDGGSSTKLHDDEWGDWHQAAGFIVSGLPVAATPGNHEFYDPRVRGKLNLNRYWRPGFTLPENGPAGLEETAYSFDYQGVRFILVNSDEMVRNEAFALSETRWVEGLLKNNPCRWTVMAFHHPLFSTAANRDNNTVRENLKPLIDKYGVDLVLTGHDHTYARGSAMPDGTERKGNAAGTVYVVSVSGPKQYKQDAKQWWDKAYTKTQLWQSVSIDGNKLTFTAYDASGSVADQFVLTKMRNGRNTIEVPPGKQSK